MCDRRRNRHRWVRAWEAIPMTVKLMAQNAPSTVMAGYEDTEDMDKYG